MACGACGGGGKFTPATYTAVTVGEDGAEREDTFLSKTQAIMHVSRAGGGEVRTNRGESRV